MPRRKFDKAMERMALKWCGMSCLALEEVQPDRKNIYRSRSFGRPVEDMEELREAVTTHAARAGEELRRHAAKRCAARASIFISESQAISDDATAEPK